MTTETLDQLDADLDAYICGDEPPDYEQPPPTLETVDEADRALRRIARIDHELARVEALAKARVEQIQAWQRDRSDVLLRARDWHERSAENWMRAHHDLTGVKTEKLPAGTLSLRKAKAKVEQTVREPDEDIDARLVRVKREWDKKAVSDACEPGPVLDVEDAPEGYEVRAVVDANGQVVNGVTFWMPTRPSFSLRTDGGES